jgi:hypothetical protein
MVDKDEDAWPGPRLHNGVVKGLGINNQSDVLRTLRSRE